MSHSEEQERLFIAQKIDRLCDAFEEALLEGEQTSIESMLETVAPEHRTLLLEQLLKIEWECLPETLKNGIQKYRERFPKYSETVTRVFEEFRCRDGVVEETISMADQFEETAGIASQLLAEHPDASQFGEYVLLQEIARGGMGVVYKAQQLKANRVVALKMILSGNLAGDEEVKRFYTEAELAANLQHPNIVPVYDVGNIEGQHYFSMGYVEGQSLSDRIKTGPLPPREAVELIADVAEGIAYAHQNGTIHRDLKPANVLVDETGQPRITDFGLGKNLQFDSGLTATGQVFGTPGYMPPEQAKGLPASKSADIYSLGATLYALLTGVAPFRGHSLAGTLSQVIHQEPVPPSQLNSLVNRDLETICLKCLQKNSQSRYDSATDLLSDLRRWLNHQPILARPVSRWERFSRWCYRNPVVTALVATVLLVSVGGTIVASFFAGEAREQTKTADSEKAKANTARGRERAANEKAEVKARLAEANTLYSASLKAGSVDVSSSLLLAVEAFRKSRPGEQVYSQAADRISKELEVCGGIPLNHHFNRLTCLLITQDGQTGITAGEDRDIRLWDLTADQPGQKSILLDGHENTVTSVSVCADSRWLVSGSEDRTIRLWDLKADDPTSSARVIYKDDEPIRQVLISPDGKWIVSSGQDLRLWENSNDRPTTKSVLHSTRVESSLQITYDFRYLAASLPESIFVWDLKSTDPSTTPLVLQKAATCICLSPNGRWLAAGDSGGQIELWDLKGDAGAGSHIFFPAHSGSLSALAFAADNQLLISSGNDQALKEWKLPAELQEWKPKARLHGQGRTFSSLVTNQSGQWVIATPADHSSSFLGKLYQATASGLVFRSQVNASDSKFDYLAAFSPDGSRLLTGSGLLARLFDNRTGTPVGLSQVLYQEKEVRFEHSAGPPCLSVSPNSRWLVSGHHSGEIRRWDLQSRQIATTTQMLPGHSHPVSAVAVNNNAQIATGDDGGSIRLWDVPFDTGLPAHVLPNAHRGRVLHLKFLPAQDLLFSLGEAETPNEFRNRTLRLVVGAAKLQPTIRLEVRLWRLTSDLKSVQEISLSHRKEPLLCNKADISANGHWLATGQDDGTVTLWDLQKELGTPPLVIKPHQLALTGLTFSPDSRFLLTQSEAICLWDLHAAELTTSQRILHPEYPPGRRPFLEGPLSISPDNRWILSGNGWLSHYLWDLKRPPDESFRLFRTEAKCTDFRFTPEGSRLLSTGQPGGTSLYQWDLSGPSPFKLPIQISKSTGSAAPLIVTPDSRWLITASAMRDIFQDDGTIRLWSIPIENWVEKVETSVGRNLSQSSWEQWLPDIPYRKTFPELPGGNIAKTRRGGIVEIP